MLVFCKFVTMDIQAEKYKLIEWITSLKDISLINHLKAVREAVTNDWWDELTQEERKGIEEGIQDIEEGRVYQHKEVMAEFRKRVGL